MTSSPHHWPRPARPGSAVDHWGDHCARFDNCAWRRWQRSTHGATVNPDTHRSAPVLYFKRHAPSAPRALPLLSRAFGALIRRKVLTAGAASNSSRNQLDAAAAMLVRRRLFRGRGDVAAISSHRPRACADGEWHDLRPGGQLPRVSSVTATINRGAQFRVATGAKSSIAAGQKSIRTPSCSMENGGLG